MALSCVFPPIDVGRQDGSFLDDTDVTYVPGNSRHLLPHRTSQQLSRTIESWGAPHMAVSRDNSAASAVQIRATAHDMGPEWTTRGGWDDSSQVSQSSLDQTSMQVIAEFLERIGFSSLNVLDSNGKSALHRAAQEGNAEVARSLLDDEHFTHVNAKDTTILKWTALHEASGANNAEIVKMLMDHEEFEHANTRDRNGRTCLHIAAGQGSFDVVNATVTHPRFASIGSKDNLGFTAQQRARANGHEMIAEHLHVASPTRPLTHGRL